ncbi:MAG: DNA polymerase III subunit gamma/tau [Epulopiscium sp. Nele67-Bin005]|nr:MAG: DNA polymerase III subunit gamma/tau [Epulopiscium sp. Nele67-Bin005]
MSYLALYRKYRPQIFNEVIGQSHIVKTLQNQISTKRIAHAYLFSGSRGTGKTSIAKIFARAVNCEEPIDGSACGICETCKKVEAGINVIEIDAASHNSVDNIREINEEVKYMPAVGAYKIYIIDEVHMLSTGAFNAMLKTLEEPPAHVIFILATTDPQKIPITILSRCQRYDFRRITSNNIEQRLKEYMAKEAVDIEDEALEYIARLADGGMRDALSILEQCVSFYFEEKITLEKILDLVGAVDKRLLFDMLNSLENYDTACAIKICDEIYQQGKNIRQFNNDLVEHIRNLLIAKTTHDEASVLDYGRDYVFQLQEQAKTIDLYKLMDYMKAFSKLDNELKYTSNPKTTLEILVLKLCQPSMDTSSEATFKKIIALETKLEELAKRPISVAQPLVTQEEAKFEPKKNPEAIPDEVKLMCARWDEVLEELPLSASITFRSTSPKIIEGDTLYIVHGKGMGVTIGFYIEQFREIVCRLAERQMKIVPISEEDFEFEYRKVYGDNPVTATVAFSEVDDFRAKINYEIDFD